jgi:GT2 family glycosyltransferase
MRVKKDQEISVIIPTFNSVKTLRTCIKSIQKQTLPPREVIVVDNASSDDTSNVVKKEFPAIKIFTLSENRGVTGGRNKGIREASSSSNYLFFFDHDMVADVNMLKELVKVAQSDSDIGIVTPKIYYLSDQKRIWSAGTGINLWTGQVLFRNGNEEGQFEKDEEVQVAPAAILVKKEVINKIGGFDDVFISSWEDTDFSYRAKQNGFKVFYSSKALAYHDLSFDPRNEAERLLTRYPYFIGRNRILFMRRYAYSFPIFLLFLPFYGLYYLALSLKYGKLKGYISFLRGTFDGLAGK